MSRSVLPAAGRTIGAALSAIGWSGVGATLVAFLGVLWWGFDLIANFRPQMAVGLLVVAVLYAMTAGRWWALAFLGAALVNVAVILPLYLADPAEPGPGGTLTIASFNVQTGNPNRAEVMGWLVGTEADVLLVHEGSSDWIAAAERHAASYRIVVGPPPGRVYGTIVLARDPAVAAEIVRVGLERQPIARVTASLDGEPVVILAVHPRAPIDGNEARLRDDLLDGLGEYAAVTPGSVVVAGDLNTTPWSHAFRSMAAAADLHNSLLGYGLQPTWPAGLRVFAVPIDHLLHTEDLTTVARSTGPSLGSDHRPILVTVARAAPDENG
jgi:endonuclease/exonuclease/phosphatase (EEP) superfamily protein YafD